MSESVKITCYSPNGKGFEIEKSYQNDLGYDVRASEGILIKAGQRVLVETDLIVATWPLNYGFVFKDRSGHAWKRGLEIRAGVIEGTFRDTWKVLVKNGSDEDVQINRGDKICQAILTEVIEAKVSTTDRPDKLPKTERGTNGFGSTGT